MKVQSFTLLLPLVFAVFGGIPVDPSKFNFHDSHFDPFSHQNTLLFSRERRLPPNPEKLMERLLQKFTNRPDDLAVLMKYLNLMNQ